MQTKHTNPVPTTIEELAIMVARGFESIVRVMVTKNDLREALKPFVRKEDLKGFATKADIYDLKVDLQENSGDIRKLGAGMYSEHTSSNQRITALEIKVFGKKRY